MKIRTVSLAVLATALISASATAQTLPDRLKFGLLSSVSGPNAPANTALNLATRLAVKEINEAGGIGGKPVDLVAADDGSDPTQSVNEARRLVQLEKVHVMIGPFTTQGALATAPIYTEARLLSMINSGSSAFTPQASPYGFSDYFSSEGYAKAMVDHAADVLKVKKVAIIADNSGQSKGVVADYKKFITARGLTLVAEEEHQFKATDVLPQVLNIRRSGAEALIQQSGIGEDGGLIFKTMRENGIRIPIVSSVAAVLVSSVLRTGGNDIFADNSITGLTFKAFTYCGSEAAGTAPFAKFLDRAKSFEPRNFEQLNIYAMSIMYDGVQLAKAALEATKSTDGPTLASWIVANSRGVPAVSGTFAPTKEVNFLFGAESVTLVPRPDLRRTDGMMQRAGC
jgi:ABC-type branched-subunit amino acid transport system substrate-binding protein